MIPSQSAGIIFIPEACVLPAWYRLWSLCRIGHRPFWIKSCWQFIVNLQVPALTSVAFPCARLWARVHSSDRNCWPLESIQYANRYSLCPAKTGEDRCKAQISRRGITLCCSRAAEWAETCRRDGWKHERAHQHLWDSSECRPVSGKAQKMMCGKALS